jgi:hypothetical protein
MNVCDHLHVRCDLLPEVSSENNEYEVEKTPKLVRSGKEQRRA